MMMKMNQNSLNNQKHQRQLQNSSSKNVRYFKIMDLALLENTKNKKEDHKIELKIREA
jgi:hypothetical protein